MTLSASLFHQQTLFALFLYGVSIIIALILFSFIHQKLNHPLLQIAWDKIGVPLIRTFLIIGFILLVYPINFGLESTLEMNELLNTDEKRSSFLINMVFLLTFLFPFIPVIGKWEELIIPLQSMLISIIVFRWLANGIDIENYYIFPDMKTLSLIIIISLITHWFAKYIAQTLGARLDEIYHKEGFQIMLFQAVVLIMQSPVIFIFGLYLGKQLN